MSSKSSQDYTIENINRDELILRNLCEDDYDKQYYELLQTLTQAPKPSREEFKERLNLIKKSGLIHIFVYEYRNVIIASITVMIEPKFIRNQGNVCHIEDFVINSNFQKMKLGTALCDFIKTKAQEFKCYKIILDCSDDVKGFYQKQGFTLKSCGMAYYFS